MKQEPEKSIEEIFAEDGRYPLEAVRFVREGLNHTLEHCCKPQPDGSLSEPRHVSGAELCQGLRDLAQKRWGALARSVLKKWNITTTRDFGEIVFLLVNHNWMLKQPDDDIEDFDDVYDFADAFDNL